MYDIHTNFGKINWNSAGYHDFYIKASIKFSAILIPLLVAGSII